MPTRTIDGTTLDYAEAGAGDPVVLVHGTLQDQRYWAPQMAALGARFHVMALSLRHYWPTRLTQAPTGFTIAQHTADVAAFLQSLGRPAHLVGHSRGGHVAFRVASQYPGLIARLVLAEPGGELDATLGGVPPSGAQAANFARCAAEIAAGRTEAGLAMFAETIYGPGGWDRWTAARRQIGYDNALTLLGQVHENRLPYARMDAEAVSVPTLLVNGDQTAANFIRIAEALATAIPDARRAVIPDARHAMSVDNPAAFNDAVLRFLGG